jgi:hypothetical protein
VWMGISSFLCSPPPALKPNYSSVHRGGIWVCGMDGKLNVTNFTGTFKLGWVGLSLAGVLGHKPSKFTGLRAELTKHPGQSRLIRPTPPSPTPAFRLSLASRVRSKTGCPPSSASAHWRLSRHQGPEPYPYFPRPHSVPGPSTLSCRVDHNVLVLS